MSEATTVAVGSAGIPIRGLSYVTNSAHVQPLLTALDGYAGPVACDFETTGLNPRSDAIRLVSLSWADQDVVVDARRVEVAQILDAAFRHHLFFYNGGFEFAFLHSRSPWTSRTSVRDLMLEAQALDSGRSAKVSPSLAEVAEACLGIELDKTLQTSDWSVPELSQAQLEYAVRDARVLLHLAPRLAQELQSCGLDLVAGCENQAMKAISWMTSEGVPFSPVLSKSVCDEENARAQELEAELAEIVRNILGAGRSVNWRSPKQVKAFLAKAGIRVHSTAADTLKLVPHPAAHRLLELREALKRAATFKGLEGDRIYPQWRQIGTVTGRMSCGKPNLQNIPRTGRHRACLRPAHGRVLVRADYAQIEVRIAAMVSGDANLKEILRQRGDVHTNAARQILGKSEPTKEDRRLAKSLIFGLLFGMSVEGLRWRLSNDLGREIPASEALALHRRFFQTFSGLKAWQDQAWREVPQETWTLGCRRRVFRREDTIQARLNAPVQGTGADGLKYALLYLLERRDEVPSAVPVMVVHDEIVVEVDEDEAENAKGWLVDVMKQGMQPLLEDVPVEVGAEIVKKEEVS